MAKPERSAILAERWRWLALRPTSVSARQMVGGSRRFDCVPSGCRLGCGGSLSPTQTDEHIGKLDDGRWFHIVRQSELSNYVEKCQQGVLLDRLHPEKRTESDAAAIGTAIHAGIQWLIDQRIFGLDEDPYRALEICMAEWSRIKKMPNFSYVKYDSPTAERYIADGFGKWFSQIFPKCDSPLGAEVEFRRLVLHEDDERVIYANGTIDYVNGGTHPVWDWKTASRSYAAWEKQRWAIQPTMYLWAAREIGLLPQTAPWRFNYIVMIHGKDVQTVPVDRHPGDVEWMRLQAIEMCKRAERDAQWALGDAGWWCSPKWCAHWNQCKGQFALAA